MPTVYGVQKRLAYAAFFMLCLISWAMAGVLPDDQTQTAQQIPQIKTQNNPDQQKDTTGPKSTTSIDKNEAQFKKEAANESPSFQQKEWTGTQGSAETNVSFDYVGRASTNVGFGENRNIDENNVDVRHLFMRHTLLAFLIQGGFEYQHMGFGVPNASLVPDRLDQLMGIVGIDFRWSEKDLMHIEGRPGLYTDFRGAGYDAFNTPLDIGYTRVVNHRFQWVAGFSLNTWRASRFLGAAGFRWQVNDRWKLKFYLPSPDIEYTARPNLTLTLGADIRGETYRVGPRFGDSHGAPNLNMALVDYEEVRVGPGFSWNIKPLIELNFMTGYMTGRQFDFHNEGPKLNGSGAPFVSINIHCLFKLPGEPLQIPQRSDVSIHNIFNFL